MTNLIIRDMTEVDEQYVGTCTHVNESDEIDACARRRLPWLKEMYAKGLRVKVALLENQQVGFLYLVPIEFSPWGPLGEELIVIPCLIVTELAKHRGIGRALLEEAQEETLMILSLYKEFVETELAIPVLTGIKSEREKFAGAVKTYAMEALMSDGKALQMGTSHNLGQNFSKVFNIRFEDRNQKLQHVWQTSWGASTRLVGALIMAHGDDSGLKIPPRIAPFQVVVIPISIGEWKKDVLPVAQKIVDELKKKGIRVKLDEREEFTPGWKFSEWEMRGVPLRMEIGPKDIEKKQVVVVRRDTGKKEALDQASLDEKVRGILEDIQKNMFEMALIL